MGTLTTEHVGEASLRAGGSSIYVDANIPAGLVAFMHRGLALDVLLATSDSRRRTLSPCSSLGPNTAIFRPRRSG